MENSFLTKYNVEQELGGKFHRKMNRVYLLKNKLTQEKVVLKVFQKTHAQIHLLPLFQQEGKFVFESPFLPKVLEYTETEEEACLILSYKAGIPLDLYWKSIRRKEQLPFLKQLIKKLAPLFAELKAKNIVHGDLKPGNILIEKLESDFEVHLIDLGIAIQPNEQTSRKALFSIAYSAPELILERYEVCNSTSDYYSLACIIYRLVCDKLPYHHANPAILTNLQITQNLPKNAALSNDLYLILAKMTKKGLFRLPPNQLSNEEVKTILQDGIAKRFQDFEEIERQFKELRERSTFEKLRDILR